MARWLRVQDIQRTSDSGSERRKAACTLLEGSHISGGSRRVVRMSAASPYQAMAAGRGCWHTGFGRACGTEAQTPAQAGCPRRGCSRAQHCWVLHLTRARGAGVFGVCCISWSPT